MSTFALDVSSSPGDIITGLNYALANLGQGSATGLAANVLVANISTGEITTTSSNSGGYTDTTIVSYLYRYMDVKYANSSTGSSGFTSNCTLAQYYGLRNTSNVTVSSNPADYVWYQVSGGFGTTKNLWYATIGGRQIATFAGTAAPQVNYVPVPDMPLPSSPPIDLDAITAAAGNQVVVTNAYLRANTQPATPTGGFYDFATFTLYAPAGWSANVPAGDDPVYTSQAAFSGQINSNVSPQTSWSYPNILSSNFAGNTGPQGQRGPIPMAYVLTDADPTGYNDSQYTAAFSASRSNAVPPIGTGYTPITGDTSQFLYANLISPNDSITVVKTFDGNTFPQWSTVVGEVISGNLFVTGTVTSSALNTNDIYTINTQSTNANIGNIASAGYWFQANTGDARMAGNVSIGNYLTVGQNAQIGSNLLVGTNASIGNNLSVGTNANIGNSLTIANNLSVGANASIGTNLSVGTGATIGTNLLVGANATIGSNLTVGTNALIGSNLSVGTNATIGSDLSIGANATIGDSLVIGNNATIGNDVTIGANLSLGANLNIGDNLIVGNNASIGSNLSVAGLITTGSLDANTVTTNNMVITSATQVITQADNTSYPLLNFVNGNTTIGGTGYLWPPFTRGIVVSAPITTTTNGSQTGSAITVNWNTYLYSDTAVSSYNCIELYKSGSSSYYRNVFNRVQVTGEDSIFGDTYIIPGNSGSLFRGNIGNINSVITGTTNDLYDGFDLTGSTGYYWAFGASGQTASLLGGAKTLSQAVTASGSTGSALPLFDIYGVSYTENLNGPTIAMQAVMVGADGQIARWSGASTFFSGGVFAFETSGTLNDLYDVSADWGINPYIAPAGTLYNYVVVGAAGLLLYNSRTYNANGTLAGTTGWTPADTGTIKNLNAVTSNYTVTVYDAPTPDTGTRGNTWVAVGDQGTILYSSSTSGPWTLANSVPTTNTLNGVGYSNGYWVAVGDAGTVIYSTDASNWTAANIAAVNGRNLYGVGAGPVQQRFAIGGEELIILADTSDVATTAWSNVYIGGASLTTDLTRVQYYGSWANIANVSQPPVQQRVTNGQVVSGNYTDIDYASGDTISYYLVVGNMSGNANVYTNSSSITVTEIKR